MKHTDAVPKSTELELQLFKLKNPMVKATIIRGEVVYLGEGRFGNKQLPCAAPKWSSSGDASLDLIAEYDIRIAHTEHSVCATRFVEGREHSVCEIVSNTNHGRTTEAKKEALLLAVMKLAIELETIVYIASKYRSAIAEAPT